MLLVISGFLNKNLSDEANSGSDFVHYIFCTNRFSLSLTNIFISLLKILTKLRTVLEDWGSRKENQIGSVISKIRRHKQTDIYHFTLL